MEALTGAAAVSRFQTDDLLLRRVGALVKSADADVLESIERLLAERRELEREVETLKGELARSSVGDLVSGATEVDGFRVVAAAVPGLDRGQLRALADAVRSKLGSGVVAVGSGAGDKVALVCTVTKDLAGKRVHAGRLVGEAAKVVGGRGGGRPDMAEAGGSDPSSLDRAMRKVLEEVAATQV